MLLFGKMVFNNTDDSRWMNATLCRMYDPADPSTTIPMIDGGTEGGRCAMLGVSHCFGIKPPFYVDRLQRTVARHYPRTDELL